MTDEDRLTGATDDALEQALLREAREGEGARASDRARAATLAAIAGAPSGGSGAGKPGLGLGAKLALGLGFVAVATAIVLLARGGDGGGGGRATPTPETPPSAPLTIGSASTAASGTVVAPVTTVALDPLPSAAASAPLASASTALRAPAPTASDPSSTLAEEVRLIDRARKALYDHDKDGSLRALDEYDRKFPPSHPGRMAPEAKRLRDRAVALVP